MVYVQSGYAILMTEGAYCCLATILNLLFLVVTGLHEKYKPATDQSDYRISLSKGELIICHWCQERQKDI